MDDRIRKRIVMFYVAGFVNLALGLYIVIQGPAIMPPGKVMGLSLFFFAFAAVDLYFPYAIKKKLRQAQQRGNAPGQPTQGR
jgi:hypothetical protein